MDQLIKRIRNEESCYLFVKSDGFNMSSKHKCNQATKNNANELNLCFDYGETEITIKNVDSCDYDKDDDLYIVHTKCNDKIVIGFPVEAK